MNWVADAMARLDELAALEENWDSYHAVSLTSKAVATARTLCKMTCLVQIMTGVPSSFAAEPSLVPTVDGGVHLEWHQDGVDLEIYIEPDGSVTGWVKALLDNEVTETEF